RVVVLDRRMSGIFADQMRESVVTILIDDELFGPSRWRPDVIEVDLVRLQIVLQEVVPIEDPLLIAVHEAGAGLDIELRVLFLDLLKLARGVDDSVPAPGLLTNRFVVFLHTVDAERDGDVQFRTFLKNTGHVRNDALLNLT